jgi:large subunit ribosomal protein L18
MGEITKFQSRAKRKFRARKRIHGTPDRPRLSVFKSSKHITAQVINDDLGSTLASVHSYDLKERAGVETCTALGKELAKLCQSKNIAKVVFDKNGFQYHGRVKAFADGAREGGLQF